MTDNGELKACPFDKGEANFATVSYSEKTVKEQGWKQDVFHYVSCVTCGACNRGLVGHRTKEDAAKAWNTRPAQDSRLNGDAYIEDLVYLAANLRAMGISDKENSGNLNEAAEYILQTITAQDSQHDTIPFVTTEVAQAIAGLESLLLKGDGYDSEYNQKIQAGIDALLSKDSQCPYLVTSDEGTSYCKLAESGSRPDSRDDVASLKLAEMFHEAYERLAPTVGYTTNPETRVFDRKTINGKLMVKVCEEIIAALSQARRGDD